MGIHLEQQRYSAMIGSAGQIFLRGVLDESSDLQQTIELIQERQRLAPGEPIELDFKHLISGSWNGFLALDSLLAEQNHNYVLRHVSFDLFRYVALLPTLRKSRLGEIELVVVAEDRRVEVNGLDRLTASPSGRFASVDGHQIVGRHSFICGDRLPAPRWGSLKTEFDMWYDYISFATITLALAEDLARSIAMSVLRLAHELAAEYKAQSHGLKILQNIEKSVWAREAEDEARILAERACDSESAYGRIILGISEIVKRTAGIQKSLHGAEEQDRLVTLDAIQGLRTLRHQLLETVQLIENGGTETFALLISVPGKKRFDDAYNAAPPPSAESLASIRETLSIMDPLSEGSWTETLPAIFQRTQEIEQLVSNLIVLTQGFDLLRQIPEHRVAEIETIEAYLNRGAPVDELENFKSQLHDRIRKKLVTDQEKLSVDAFIPDVLAEHDSESHKPGAVLLF